MDKEMRRFFFGASAVAIQCRYFQRPAVQFGFEDDPYLAPSERERPPRRSNLPQPSPGPGFAPDEEDTARRSKRPPLQRPITEDYHYRLRLTPIHFLYYQGRHEEIRREVHMLFKTDVTDQLRRAQIEKRRLPPYVYFFAANLLGFARMDNPESELTAMASQLTMECILHQARFCEKDFDYILMALVLRSEGLAQIVAVCNRECRNVAAGEASHWLTDELVWHLLGILDGHYLLHEKRRRFLRNEKEVNAQMHLNNRVLVLRRFITGETALFNRQEGGRDMCQEALANLLRSTLIALRAAPYVNRIPEKKRFQQDAKLDVAIKELCNSGYAKLAWAGHEGLMIGCLDALKGTCWSVFQNETDRIYRITCLTLLAKWNGPGTSKDRGAMTGWGRATFQTRLAARAMQNQANAYDVYVADPRVLRTLEAAAFDLVKELGYDPNEAKPQTEPALLEVIMNHDVSRCSITPPRLRIAFKNCTDLYSSGRGFMGPIQYSNHLACAMILHAIATTVTPTPETLDSYMHSARAAIGRSVTCAALSLRLFDGLMSVINEIGGCFYLSQEGPPPRAVSYLLQSVKQMALLMGAPTTKPVFSSDSAPSPLNLFYAVENLVAPIFESLFYQCHSDTEALDRLMYLSPPTHQDKISESRVYVLVFRMAVEGLGEREAARSASLLSMCLRLRRVATGVDLEQEEDIGTLAAQLLPQFGIGEGPSDEDESPEDASRLDSFDQATVI